MAMIRDDAGDRLRPNGNEPRTTFEETQDLLSGTGERPRTGLSRREIIGAALGGLAAPLALAGGAVAETTVTPNPIRTRIGMSGLAVELVEFCTPPSTSGTRPLAMLNFAHHAGDGSGRLFAADSRGKLWAINGATGRARLFLDLVAVRGSALVIDRSPKHLGLRS